MQTPIDPNNIDPTIQQILHSIQSVLNILGLIATVVILPLTQKYGGRMQSPRQPAVPPPPSGDDDAYSKMLTGEIIKRVDSIKQLIEDKSNHSDRRFESLESSINERFQQVRERIDAQERRIMAVEGAIKSDN